MAVRCERQNNCESSSNSDNVESYALLSICILRECRLRLTAFGLIPHLPTCDQPKSPNEKMQKGRKGTVGT